MSYVDAVNGALARLEDCGFEWGPGLSLHAPMAAEALAQLGHCDDVDGWVESNRQQRSYRERPTPRWRIDPDDPNGWRAVLGDLERVADWARLFEEELTAYPWREVLVRWWPRLLPGLFGALGHGLIRTAHAVRSVAATESPTPLQLRELAQGLGYWAARYTEPPGAAVGAGQSSSVLDPDAALQELIVTNAGQFADRAPQPAVPLVHTITAPAAVRLVLPWLPPELHERSYRYARLAATGMVGIFGHTLRPGPLVPEGSAPPLTNTVGYAVETGDEHAIKLAEACLREHAARPDERYLRAAATLTRRFR